LSHSNTRHYGV